MPITGAIVQARMGSTRLPGKVMLTAAGKPLLGHLLERLSYCQTLQRVIVATSTCTRDDVIAEFGNSLGVPVFRGSETDVLDRYYQTAKKYELDIVVRVTSDCPLIDPALIDQQVEFFGQHRGEIDLLTNRHPLTFPDGLDFDVLPIESLELAWKRATEPRHREHTVPFFWDLGYRVHNFEDPQQLFNRHRWTLDYPEDYDLIRTVYEGLYQPDRLFSTAEILAFLSKNPELTSLNSAYIERQTS